ncbi:methyltransferase, FxLD system [Streptomyces sp. CL12-4]|uniref:methyltransferase, FxLD system n=1 Tax=Streptomyces sp. CL12-4 TaxID=2810306 RepID=UPI001EFAC977|nr:methyltransferase, FxLD system [Streptomyces sp. CL12-4]MCG8971764.1 methyltransferase, FxLD system [Streptomyces sp. CL12-4]
MNQNPTAAELRNKLVDEMIMTTVTLTPDVEHALRTVSREAYLPGVDLKDAYADQAVTIKENPNGPLALSCASVPSVVAMMLVQLDVQPGANILEIGAGTGYNAALLAELTGGLGSVTSIDIDPDVTLHARTMLNRTGYQRVTVIERDGLVGAPENAPYDRMLAAVGLWDVPAAWWDQLRDGGRLVLPLRWRGQTRSVALTRRGDTLVSDGMALCGFVPIIGQDGEKTAALNADDTIRVHYDEDQAVDVDALAASLRDAPGIETLSEQRVGGEEPFDGVWLRATAGDDRVCRLEVTPDAVDQDLILRPAIPVRSPVLVDGDSLAYLIVRREGTDLQRPFRLGAAAYGPQAEALAQDLITHIEAWGSARTSVPRLTITPAKTDAAVTGHVINKPESRMTLTY